MRIKNKWTHGKANFQLPPLPPDYQGMSGAMFKKMTCDPRVGEECVLLLLDDPDFSRQLGELQPFDLHATAGMVRTSAGVIAYIVWAVSNGRRHIVDYEHLLNPFDIHTIQLISGTAQQTHLKVLIVDSTSSEVVGFFEHNSDFGLDDLAAGIAQCIGNEPEAAFTQTQQAVRDEFSLEDLKGNG